MAAVSIIYLTNIFYLAPKNSDMCSVVARLESLRWKSPSPPLPAQTQKTVGSSENLLHVNADAWSAEAFPPEKMQSKGPPHKRGGRRQARKQHNPYNLQRSTRNVKKRDEDKCVASIRNQHSIVTKEIRSISHHIFYHLQHALDHPSAETRGGVTGALPTLWLAHQKAHGLQATLDCLALATVSDYVKGVPNRYIHNRLQRQVKCFACAWNV